MRRGIRVPECTEFAKAPDADLGDVLKAGCEPPLAQMAALVSNLLGNVVMLFTQFDVYSMENTANNEKASKRVHPTKKYLDSCRA